MPKRTGIAELALVRGSVPHYKEMVKLSKAIVAVIVNEMGTEKLIKRMSDPLWFSCLSCTLGFEWNTSGQTTVTLSALKTALSKENLGVKVVGGKGRKMRGTKSEIIKMSDELGLREKKIKLLKKASRLPPRVDSNALQDDHSVYFHSLLFDEKGNYSVIDQGMDTGHKTARRYHWLSNLNQFVEEPHNAILGNEKREVVLDLTDERSKECRKSVVDIVKDEKPEKIQKMFSVIRRPKEQKTLTDFIQSKNIEVVKIPGFLRVPKRINLNALRIASGQISGFEDLVSTKGVGPATIRGLAYISDLIYGTESSWEDPMSYSFSHGTKSGRPYYVEKESMERNAEILSQAVEEARIGKKEKLDALKRLNKFI